VKNKNFLEALSSGPLVADGAMGTRLYERGVFINKSLEEANLNNQNLVRQIHKEYIDAGADLIETHTFGANRIKLAKYGLEDKIKKINLAAVDIARKVAGEKIFVAGSIGPTGLNNGFKSENIIYDAYLEQARLLLEGGVDLIILESFRFLKEILIALKAVREGISLPVVAQMAFSKEGKTVDGADPLKALEILKEAGADVVGVNCTGGPRECFSISEKMIGHGIPVSVQPNAGAPDMNDDRMFYLNTPEYSGVFARRFFRLGAAIVGGCCGTGPDHIRKISNSARMMGGRNIQIISSEKISQDQIEVTKEIPPSEKTNLAKKIMRIYKERVKAKNPLPIGPENFAVSVEVNPPSGLDLSKALEIARMLRDGGVDVINIADGPRATVRVSNHAMGALIQKELQMEIILHVCCRDRNLLGLQSDLLADHIIGLHNLVVITGDPPKMGDYPHATGVFDLDSIGLLKVIRNLNRGLDPSGKMMNESTKFFCACGAEPAALNYEREIKRLELKREAGAEFIMTQPVYDPSILRRFLDDIKHLSMPVLVGILPLAGYKNALFLHKEVPGMHIPDDILERMREAGSGPKARKEGIKIAREALIGVAHDVVGAYIMPSLGHYSSALDILECVGYKNHIR
jgi:methionine synthase / methylenetetrahydrofolate reductase(NADPH)